MSFFGAQQPGGGTPKKKTSCHCSKSRCLKLYCECFARKEACGPSCACVGCCNSNTEEHSAMREVLFSNWLLLLSIELFSSVSFVSLFQIQMTLVGLCARVDFALESAFFYFPFLIFDDSLGEPTISL